MVLDLASAILSAISATIILTNSVLMLLASVSKVRPLELNPGNTQVDVDVTIVVPAYREGPHIRYLLQSLKGVEYPKDRLRLVVVGEREDVETFQEMTRLCNVSDRYLNCGGVRGVYVINESGLRGKPAALNFALKYVDTDIVAVYDAEDTIHPKHVSAAVKLLLEDSSVAAVQFVREIAYVPGKLAEAQLMDFYFYYMILQPYLMRSTGLAEICGSAFFIKLPHLKNVGGFNTASPTEDLDLTYRIGARGLRILLALPPSTTRPIIRTSSLVKQRARWIRGGILSIPVGLGAAPRSLPLLLVTGFTPIATVTTTLTVLIVVAGLFSGSTLALAKYVALVLVFTCSLGVFSALAGSPDKTKMLKYLAVISVIYYLASWRAIAELVASPRSWTKSDSKA